MKYLYVLVLLLLLTVGTSAQNLSGSSDLVVLQKKWRINSINPSSSMLNTDPFQPINETSQKIQDQKDTHRENEIRKQMGLRPKQLPVRMKGPEAHIPDAVSTSYTYQIKVRNNGTKTIQMIAWDYVFFDSSTNQEVGRHQFESKTKLKPRETDNLVIKLFSAPARTIDAKDAGKKLSNLYVEEVNIRSIQYTDGSVWQADSK
jgi:hypothetical protein